MCLHECVCTRVGVSILAYAQSPEKGLRSLRTAVTGTRGTPACYTSVGIQSLTLLHDCTARVLN